MCVYIYVCIFSKTEHLGKAKLQSFHKEDSFPPVLILRICSHHEGSKPAVSGHYTTTANKLKSDFELTLGKCLWGKCSLLVGRSRARPARQRGEHHPSMQ